MLQSSDRSAILNILNYHCRCIVTWHLLAANRKLVENYEPSKEKLSTNIRSEYVSDFCHDRKSPFKADFLSWQKLLATIFFSDEISQVIIAAMVLAPNFYRKNCLRVISAMRGNPPLVLSKSKFYTISQTLKNCLLFAFG